MPNRDELRDFASTQTDCKFIICQGTGHVAYVEANRPEVRNPQGGRDVRLDPSIRCGIGVSRGGRGDQTRRPSRLPLVALGTDIAVRPAQTNSVIAGRTRELERGFLDVFRVVFGCGRHVVQAPPRCRRDHPRC